MTAGVADLLGVGEAIEVDLDDRGVLTITLARPDAANSRNQSMRRELAATWTTAAVDEAVRVVVLTGKGDRHFCAGMDLKEAGQPETPVQRRERLRGARDIEQLARLPRPTIAAINGYALGGGFEIALACHLVVADRTATFGLPEVRVGLIAAAGGLVRLPRALPEKLANELILTGRRATAEELAAHGVVTRIAEDGEVMAVARDLAAEIISRSPTSVRHSLRAMAAGREVADVVDAIEAGQPALDDLLMTDDLHEGVQAFAGKREPRWRNR